MSKAQNKTQKTEDSVEKFLNSIQDKQKRADAFEIDQLLQETTKQKPQMWGSSIIGYGDWHYISPKTGREGDWFAVGFSPRKAAITLYIKNGFNQHPDLLQQLGKHTVGVGCLYIKKLSDIDIDVLKELIRKGLETD